MGSETFCTKAKGKTAKEAFQSAVDDARYNHGHAGYTGTIAEKNDYTMIPLPAGAIPKEEANRLINACDPRIDDKWGPAGCFDVGNGEFYFFGWASS